MLLVYQMPKTQRRYIIMYIFITIKIQVSIYRFMTKDFYFKMYSTYHFLSVRDDLVKISNQLEDLQILTSNLNL